MAKVPVLKPVFKAYHQRQVMLLPPSLDELIAAAHPVRVVDEVLSKIDLQPFPPLLVCPQKSQSFRRPLLVLLTNKRSVNHLTVLKNIQSQL